MKRISSNFTPSVKQRVQDLKKHLKLNNESQVVGYLLALYDIKYETLTVREHESCLETSRALNDEIE